MPAITATLITLAAACALVGLFVAIKYINRNSVSGAAANTATNTASAPPLHHERTDGVELTPDIEFPMLGLPNLASDLIAALPRLDPEYRWLLDIDRAETAHPILDVRICDNDNDLQLFFGQTDLGTAHDENNNPISLADIVATEEIRTRTLAEFTAALIDHAIAAGTR